MIFSKILLMPFYEEPKFDELVKSRKTPFFVIPAKAGIQFIQLVTKFLGSSFTGVTTFYETIKFCFKEGRTF